MATEICDEKTSNTEISRELNPYAEQIKEIESLCNLLTAHKVPTDLLDFGTRLAFDAMRKRGEIKEAYDYLLEQLQKKAAKHGIES